MHILGEVEGKDVIIVDDLIATGGSLIEAAEAINKAGARNIRAAITHGVLSGPAIKRIDQCKELKELAVTDTIPLGKNKQHSRIKVLTVANLLGEAIKRIHKDESVSSLFD